MKTIDLIATHEHIDAMSGTVTYKVDGTAPPEPGLIVLGPAGSGRDMIIMNPHYTGGELVVKMRPLRSPAKKYKLGEVVACLVVM